MASSGSGKGVHRPRYSSLGVAPSTRKELDEVRVKREGKIKAPLSWNSFFQWALPILKQHAQKV